MRIRVLVILILIGSVQLFAQKNRKSFPDETVDEKLPDLVLNTTNNFIINPALTGFEKRNNLFFQFENLNSDAERNILSSSDQLKKSSNTTLAFDKAFLKSRRLGAGLSYALQQSGITQTNQLNFSLSYRFIVLRNNRIHIGFSASMIQQNFDFNEATFNDQIDPIAGFVYNTIENIPVIGTFKGTPVLDLKAGLIIKRNRWFAGYTIIHLNEPGFSVFDDPYAVLQRSHLLYLSYAYPVKNMFKFNPVLRLNLDESGFTIFNTAFSANLKERLMVMYEFEFSTQNIMYHRVNAAFTLYRQLIISSSFSFYADNDFNSEASLASLRFGILYQFGKTKKDLTKWRNF